MITILLLSAITNSFAGSDSTFKPETTQNYTDKKTQFSCVAKTATTNIICPNNIDITKEQNLTQFCRYTVSSSDFSFNSEIKTNGTTGVTCLSNNTSTTKNKINESNTTTCSVTQVNCE